MTNHPDPGAKFSSLFDAAQKEHYFQLTVIDSLVAKSKVLLGFLVALVAFAIAQLSRISVPYDSMELLLITLLVIVFVSAIASGGYLARAFRGLPYRNIPSFCKLEDHFNEDKQEKDAKAWVQKQYHECADRNRKSHSQRAVLLDKGTCCLIIATILVLLTATIQAVYSASL